MNVVETGEEQTCGVECGDRPKSGRIAEAYPNVRRAILLNCFGRGGSSIMWNMIGSSPDVLMPSGEWHEAFYGRWPIVGRALRRVTRPTGLNVPALRPLSWLVRKRAFSSVPQDELRNKPRATSIVLKLMDHHIAMNSAIAASFPEASQVVLVRNPLAQCESFLRSGLNLKEATARYTEVMGRLITLAARSDTFVYRFDDLVRNPFAARDDLYDRLSISVSSCGSFKMKHKKFGEDRTPAVRRAIGPYVDVTPQNVSELIDKDVNKRSVLRLSDEQRAFIWQETNEVASYFHYAPWTA